MHWQAGGLAEDDFLMALDADAIAAAGDALLEAVQDFSPSRTRPLIAALRNKGQQVLSLTNEGMAEAVGKIDAMNPAMILNSISTSNVSAPLASSESIPVN